MTQSILDSFCEIDSTHCTVSLIKQSVNRKKGQKGLLGFLIIEAIDEAQNHLIYKVDFPFGTTNTFQVTTLFKSDLVKPKQHLANLSAEATYTWTISKDKFNQTDIEKLVIQNPSQPWVESSYKKALIYLDKTLGITKTSDEDPEWLPSFNLNTKVSWNPFSRLKENKLFPHSRFIFSSLYQRLKDCFFILNGDVNNHLGLLDFLFPIPYLLTRLLASEAHLLIKIGLAIPTALTLAIKYVIGFSITLLLIPFIGLIDLGCHLLFPSKNALDETIQIKPIKNALESFVDVVPEKDLEEVTFLPSFTKIHKHLTIRPLTITPSGNYEEVSSLRTFKDKEDHLAFGICEYEKPVAVMELNGKNKPGIFNLMRKNQYQIDNYLDNSNISTQILEEQTTRQGLM